MVRIWCCMLAEMEPGGYGEAWKQHDQVKNDRATQISLFLLHVNTTFLFIFFKTKANGRRWHEVGKKLQTEWKRDSCGAWWGVWWLNIRITGKEVRDAVTLHLTLISNFCDMSGEEPVTQCTNLYVTEIQRYFTVALRRFVWPLASLPTVVLVPKRTSQFLWGW